MKNHPNLAILKTPRMRTTIILTLLAATTAIAQPVDGSTTTQKPSNKPKPPANLSSSNTAASP